MRKLSLLTLAALAAALLTAQPASATIRSINLFRGDSTSNCEDTIPGSGCSPLGITLAGGVTNPLLNNTGTKAISLEPGSYYIFGNPYAGTSFMTQGSAISVFLRVSDPDGHDRLLIGNSTVPNLATAGTTVFDFAAYGIKITTTGITTADRMSFGYPPNAFAADGNPDFVLRLDYLVPTAVVPEPATWALMVGGFGLMGGALRRRSGLRAA